MPIFGTPLLAAHTTAMMCDFGCHLLYLFLTPVTVCHSNVQSLECVCRLVKCQLRPQQRPQPSTDTQDCRASWPWDLHAVVPVCKYCIFRCSFQGWFEFLILLRAVQPRTTNEHHDGCFLILQAEIEKSGTTVAALFFKNVFGTSAERALAVFVALRSIRFISIFWVVLTALTRSCTVLLEYAILLHFNVLTDEIDHRLSLLL